MPPARRVPPASTRVLPQVTIILISSPTNPFSLGELHREESRSERCFVSGLSAQRCVQEASPVAACGRGSRLTCRTFHCVGCSQTGSPFHSRRPSGHFLVDSTLALLFRGTPGCPGQEAGTTGCLAFTGMLIGPCPARSGQSTQQQHVPGLLLLSGLAAHSGSRGLIAVPNSTFSDMTPVP